MDQDKLGDAGRASRRTRYRRGGFLPFEEARAYARSLNLKGRDEWSTWAKSTARPANIPASPSKPYKDKGWLGWGDWLGTLRTQRGTFLSFKEAREYARSLNLKSQGAWAEWTKSAARPSNIPASPTDVYKNKGWLG